MTIPRGLLWHFESSAERVALLDGEGHTISYGNLGAGSARIAEQIPGRSVVLCLCSNSIACITGYVGFLNAGIVPLLLEAEIDSALLHNIISTYEPNYVWTPSDKAAAFKKPPLFEHRDYQLIEMTGPSGPRCHENLALLLTTSGSTGSPKLVRQSYTNIHSNMVSIARYLSIEGHDRAITSMPLNYTFGLSILHSHLHVGASIVVTPESVMQRGFWSLLNDLSVTSLSGVPFTYEMLNRLRFFTKDYPTLHTLTQAGGKLPTRLQEIVAKYAQRTGKRFFIMYGQTEATARMSYLPHDRCHEKPGSIGVPIPGGQLYLQDEKGEVITTPDVEGELVYEGPNVALGYAQTAHDLGRGDDFAGRLLTGDLATMDDEGFFFVTGRRKRFLKIFGNRVSLEQIEELLREAFPGTGLACSGTDNNLQVFITQEDLSKPVHVFLVQKTGFHKSAFSVLVVSQIPKNSAGKTLYAHLNALTQNNAH